MTDNLFNDRIRAAEDALRKRRGKPPASERKVNGGGGSALDMLEVKKQISQHVSATELRLERKLEDLAERALESVRRTEIVIHRPNEVDVTLEGTHHALFPTLVQAAELREPILLSGPAGSGKSTAGKKLADMLGLSFGYIGQTNMPHIVVGSMHPIDKTYRHTAFTNAFINGGVIMLEEMDAWNPNASLVINPPLANRWLTLENGEQYEQHKDCIIIACANTWGTGATAEYVGRNKLDAAFLDRFGVKLHWGYDMDLEIAACGNLEVARAVQMARYNAERYGIKVVISPRSSITIAKMVRAGIDMKAAMEMNFLATVDDNTKRKLLEDVNV